MVNFINKNNIFSDTQYGFRKNKSTESALIDFIDYVHNGLSNKENVGSIFMDLSKAFDVMDHSILKTKLEHYGFRGKFLDYLMSFMKNREYFVHANGYKSNTETVNIGVPQGSTLGPLLFLIYVNDMKYCSKILKFIKFTDDTTIFLTHSDILELNRIFEIEATKVIKWLSANKLNRPVILAFNDKQIAIITISIFLGSISLVDVVKKNPPNSTRYKLPKNFLFNFLWAKNAKIAQKTLIFHTKSDISP